MADVVGSLRTDCVDSTYSPLYTGVGGVCFIYCSCNREQNLALRAHTLTITHTPVILYDANYIGTFISNVHISLAMG
jgi:hypothetical protein